MAKSSKKNKETPLEPVIESVLTFDGQDDWVELPPASIPSGNEITCSFWAYGGAALPKVNSAIEALNAKDQRLLNVHLIWNNSIVYFDCGSRGTSSDSYDRMGKQINAADCKGKWSHWAFTKNATTGQMKIYLNGELWHHETGKTSPIPPTAKARLGCSFSSQFYPGKLAQVQLWSRERTQAEIQQDMSRRLRGDELGLVSYWPLNEGSGAIAHDKTSNANHGTIYGNPSWELSTLSLEDATPSQDENIDSAVNLPTGSIQEPIITKIGPAGGAIAATDFAIQPRTGAAASKIKSVSISSGWAVDKIQVHYENPDTNPPETYASDILSSGGGKLSAFSLAPGDYLTSVSGTWGARSPGRPKEEIISLQFHTHQGVQSQVFGGGHPQKEVEPFTLVAPEGSEIIGFFGAYGSFQNCLVRFGIYTRPVPSAIAAIGDVDPLGHSASASPNIAPSPSTVSPEQLAELSHPVPSDQSGELNQPASAPPNVAPAPPTTIEPTEPSSSLTPVPSVAPPIPPVRLQGRQMVLVLDEKHQGISAGSGALRPQGRFTIEAWVHPARDAGKQVIYAEGGTLFYLEGSELKFQTPLSSEAIASSGAGITSGSWYHVAVTRAGSRPGNTKLYINGVHNDNQAAISPVLAFGNTYLGRNPDVPDSGFQGKLLEVRVWRFARSQAEIEANRLYPMTGRELGLVRYWSLTQTVGSTLHDKTTNRAVGTLSGDAVWEEVEIPLKLKLDPQERLTRSTGLEDYGYWYKEMAKQQKTEADPPFLRGRIWA